MNIEIKKWWTNACLWSGEAEDLKDALQKAVTSHADLRGANLGGADLGGADLRDADLGGADLRGANLGDADLRGADLRGASYRGVKLGKVRSFAGLYQYQIWAVVAADGTAYVRMGCFWKTIAEWDLIGIRASNVGKFPDDKSERCEERARAFEFARAEALAMQSSFVPEPEVPA